LSNEEIAFEANKRGLNLKGMTFSGKLLIDPKEVKEKNLPTRAISLMWNQRSTDSFLGLPFNIASYGLLLEIIAKEVNMVPDELIGNLGDTHLYANHVEQAREQVTREPYALPKLMCLDEFHYLMDPVVTGDVTFVNKLGLFRPDFFILENYQAHPTIKAPLSN
jgi:thymidylate synthase